MLKQSIMSNLSIRPACEDETGIVLEYIRRIARFEKLEHQVETTEELLYDALFVKKYAEVVLAILDGKPIGFALFFHNFSTFVGRPGLYLEDLYIDEEYRGKGYGKKVFLHLVSLAKERNCGRMEWTALNWNRNAIDFYHSLGAIAMNEWTTFRLTEEGIAELT